MPRLTKSAAKSPDESAAAFRLRRRDQSRLHQTLEQVRKFHAQGMASRKRYPRSRVPFAGRPSRKPKDKDDALVLIAQVCRRWEGLVGVLMPESKPIVPLPNAVVKRMRKADAVMRELAREVDR